MCIMFSVNHGLVCQIGMQSPKLLEAPDPPEAVLFADSFYVIRVVVVENNLLEDV